MYGVTVVVHTDLDIPEQPKTKKQIAAPSDKHSFNEEGCVGCGIFGTCKRRQYGNPEECICKVVPLGTRTQLK